MDVILDNISKVLMEIHSITFDLAHHHVRYLAHVINLSARKLIDSLYITVQYEDESSFEEIEDTEDNLLDAIYKVIILQRKHY
jgi:hypothetical protein